MRDLLLPRTQRRARPIYLRLTMSISSLFNFHPSKHALLSEEENDQELASSSSAEKSHYRHTAKDNLIQILAASTTLLIIVLLVLHVIPHLPSMTRKGRQDLVTPQCQSRNATTVPYSSTPASYTLAPYPDIHSPPIRSKLLVPSPWSYENPIHSPCGYTPASARAANCQWSAMTFGWYPPACFDAALEAEFLQLKNWTWHFDESLSDSSIIPREDVLRGDVRRAWVSVEFHMQHCDFSTRKLLRALLGVVLSDNYVIRMGHLLHCEKFKESVERSQKDGEKNVIIAAKGVAKYFDCVTIWCSNGHTMK